MASRVSIVLTNYNGLENLQACLPGVMRAAAHQGLVDEVLLVDDCSSDESLSWLAAHHPEVRVLALTVRSGFLGAANAGFAAAKNRRVLLLSNDMVPREDVLVPLLPHFADAEVFAVSALLKAPTGELEGGRNVGLFAFGNMFLLNSAKGYRPFRALVRNRDDVTLPSFFTGGNALYDREKFQDLGGFDALYHPFYWEDTDLCYRAWKRGWRVLIEPAAEVVHHQRLGTIRKNYDRSYIRGVRTRNRFLFLWKNVADPLYLAEHLIVLLLLLPTAWLAGNLRFYRSLALALARLPLVLERRRAAPVPVRSDREVLRQVRSDEPHAGGRGPRAQASEGPGRSPGSMRIRSPGEGTPPAAAVRSDEPGQPGAAHGGGCLRNCPPSVAPGADKCGTASGQPWTPPPDTGAASGIATERRLVRRSYRGQRRTFRLVPRAPSTVEWRRCRRGARD